MAEGKNEFREWCIIELFGHQRMAGLVSEQTIGGQSFIRVDVPEGDGQAAYTRFLGNGAIYAITPTDEATARRAAGVFRPAPVQRYELPAPPPAGPDPGDDDDDFALRDDGPELP